MYGTIARMRIKPGAQGKLREFSDYEMQAGIPGYLGGHVYQSDADPNEFFVVVLFESRDAYHANAQSPAQHERYLQMMDMLDGEPEWHDGEIVWSSMG